MLGPCPPCGELAREVAATATVTQMMISIALSATRMTTRALTRPGQHPRRHLCSNRFCLPSVKRANFEASPGSDRQS